MCTCCIVSHHSEVSLVPSSTGVAGQDTGLVFCLTHMQVLAEYISIAQLERHTVGAYRS